MNENEVKKNEEEKKKKRGILFLLGSRVRKGRLLFLLVAFMLTLVGLSVSTYAWFTSNFTVSVQEIEVNVSSGSGIQISTNAKDWKSIITVQDITENAYSAATNQVPTDGDEMNPVSTVKAVDVDATTASAGLHMYKGTIVNDENTGVMYLNSVSETDGSNSDYVAFDLFIKMDFSEAKRVYFTGTTGVVGGDPNTRIQYSSRMGFVVQGHDESSATETTLRNLKGDTNAPVYIYEPNYDVHTANGLANGRNNYNITDRTQEGNATPAQYYGVKNTFAYDPEVEGSGTVLNDQTPSKFEVVTPDYKTTLANTQPFDFIDLQPGVTKLRVYMWVEGQDIDCENTASGGEITFNLGFTVEGPETQSGGSGSTGGENTGG